MKTLSFKSINTLAFISAFVLALFFATALDTAHAAALNEEPGVIPGKGGSVLATETGNLSFAPEYSGFWVFETSGGYSGDPYLEIYDASGDVIAFDDDSGGDYHAYAVVFLEKGQEYTIYVGNYDDRRRSFTLTAEELKPHRMEEGGVFVEGNGCFEIKPENDGIWEFRAEDYMEYAPYLRLYDQTGELIANEWDIVETRSLMFAYLTKGETYILLIERGSSDNNQAYTIYAFEMPSSEIYSTGGEILTQGSWSLIFTPDKNGIWEIGTYDSNGDPFLFLYEDGIQINFDDDGGDDLDASITAYLSKDSEYIISLGFYEESGSCLLRVSPGPVSELIGEYVVFVDKPMGFDFTPDSSGYWAINTVKVRSSYPELWLCDEEGELIITSFYNEYDENRHIFAYLEKDRTYTIIAGFYYEGGSYNLRTSPLQLELPGTGGEVVIEGEAYYLFTPETNGPWEFRSFNNKGSDPRLYLYNQEGMIIAEDDDGAGNYNALIIVDLTVGEAYVIRAGHNEGSGSYSLSVELLN